MESNLFYMRDHMILFLYATDFNHKGKPLGIDIRKRMYKDWMVEACTSLDFFFFMLKKVCHRKAGMKKINTMYGC